MTLILALYTKDGRALVGGDSGTFTDEGAVHMLPEGKVFRVGSAYVVGCAGSRRFAEVMQYQFKPAEPETTDPASVDSFMVCQFVPALRELLSNTGLVVKGNSGAEEDGELIQSRSGCVVAVKGVGVYYLSGDFACTRAAAERGEAMTATGGGSKYGLASLLSTVDDEDPVRRITTALEVTAKLYNCVREPFTVVEA